MGEQEKIRLFQVLKNQRTIMQALALLLSDLSDENEPAAQAELSKRYYETNKLIGHPMDVEPRP